MASRREAMETAIQRAVQHWERPENCFRFQSKSVTGVGFTMEKEGL